MLLINHEKPSIKAVFKMWTDIVFEGLGPGPSAQPQSGPQPLDNYEDFSPNFNAINAAPSSDDDDEPPAAHSSSIAMTSAAAGIRLHTETTVSVPRGMNTSH